MSNLVEAVTTIAIAIVGVAILALIVSPKARTSQVIQASASGFGNSLAVAMTPVTGEHVNIDTSYPGGGMSSFRGGYPQFNYTPGLN
ncbi:MAG: hypothetical protein WC130_12530 [Kiritimatiellia bacterium]|jgi:hypothetical protein